MINKKLFSSDIHRLSNSFDYRIDRRFRPNTDGHYDRECNGVGSDYFGHHERRVPRLARL
jgi:hypothetical protein